MANRNVGHQWALRAVIAVFIASAGMGCGMVGERPDTEKLLSCMNGNRWLDESSFRREAEATVRFVRGKAAMKLRWNAERPQMAEIDPDYGIPFDQAATPMDLAGMSATLAQREVLAWYADRRKLPANSLKPYFTVRPGLDARWDAVQAERGMGSGSMAWIDAESGGIGFQFENRGQVERFTLKRPWLHAGGGNRIEWLLDRGTLTAWFRVNGQDGQQVFQYAPRKDVVMQIFR